MEAFCQRLGVLLAVIGAGIMLKAVIVETVDGELIGKWAWKPLFFIIASNLLFGILLGGLPSIKVPADYVAEDNIVGGNVILFGATSGQAYLRGVVGERFAVRNSGAQAVVEGVGDHGCEYMTGGKVVILGSTGRNFAAGMSGGMAYVYDPQGLLPGNINGEMVDLDALDATDELWLHEMVTAHVDATESAVGQQILADWQNQKEQFIKVMPRDYKRVLAAISGAEAAGEDVSEAIMAAAAEAGAIRASYILMRLPFEVAPLFRAWLAAHYPDRADKVMHMVQDIRSGRDNDPDFFTRMKGQGVWPQLIRQRVKRAAREHGMDRSFPPLRSDLFRPPERDGQMELF